MRFLPVLAIVVGIFAAVSSPLADPTTSDNPEFVLPSIHPERRGIGLLDLSEIFGVLPPIKLDPDRSLFIRDVASLAGFTFDELMDQLAWDAGFADGRELFGQWFATLGTGGDDTAVSQGLACPGSDNSTTSKMLNRFPLLCDEQLADIGWQYESGTLNTVGDFKIIAAVNRIDLQQTDTKRKDCGEYRLIAAAADDKAVHSTEIYVIFEAIVLDEGNDQICQTIQKFWANFSQKDTSGAMPGPEIVAEQLRRFFLVGGKMTPDGHLLDSNANVDGATDFSPVMRVHNLGGDRREFEEYPNNVRGQIRTNTLIEKDWVLRQFAFRSIGGEYRIVPVPTAYGIDPTMFEAGAIGEQNLANIIAQSTKLTLSNINTFSIEPTSQFDASQMKVPFSEADYSTSYATMMGENPSATPVKKALEYLASADLPWEKVRTRVEAVSCAGCHHHVKASAKVNFIDDFARDVRWAGPLSSSLPVHIGLEPTSADVYPISKSLECVFLPHRASRMAYVLGMAPDPDLAKIAETKACKSYYDISPD